MSVLKKLISMLFINTISSQQPNGPILVGSQRDEHNCVLDGGYQWCDTTQSCIRPWETSCETTYKQNSNQDDCNELCPPPSPCPMPYMPNINMDNCRITTETDSCGCNIGCSHYDCSSNNCNSDLDCHINQFCRQTQMRIPMVNGRRNQELLSECVDKVGINETCGGMVQPEFQTRCLDGLECVNTMGPMIADAPGQCKEPCNYNEIRNEYGICVIQESRIPENCATFYDGCNTCQVRDGIAEICTMMYCFTNNPTRCLTYYRDNTQNNKPNNLLVGDICYRFCEYGLQEPVNRKDDCPTNSVCKSTFNENSVSMISYDSCNDRAWTCQIEGH